ncbi:MAG: 5-(carboxyamino)imidazole ribonucleotide synthase [Verrucomicrobiota bacterium]
MILPGATIGCLGGGQLGRMLGSEARRMGYGFHVYEPSAGCPAGHIAGREFNAPYEDLDALEKFAKSVDVITFEFENIPTDVLQELVRWRPVYPNWQALSICQNREREKTFLRDQGIPLAPFAIIDSLETLKREWETMNSAAVLKTADFGYDGKGQVKLNLGDSAKDAWNSFDQKKAVLEQWIEFDLECSVICARSRKGEIRTFPVAENIHTDHILDLSIVPARLSEIQKQEAREIAATIAEKLDVVGLLAVELFLTRSGKLIVNELAPRTHNSGHYTLDACPTSQFEQQLRMICGLPMGDVALRSSVVMVNVLGDVWKETTPPAWEHLLKQPGVRLHLYGKDKAVPGRKMGHFCVLQDDLETAIKTAEHLKSVLKSF